MNTLYNVLYLTIKLLRIFVQSGLASHYVEMGTTIVVLLLTQTLFVSRKLILYEIVNFATMQFHLIKLDD